ncbi:DUF1942 domain-containing protein [Streptomyces sp. NPDC007907]|uniref:DUF1942 domain-containing protein n=1 Tax=Streptomyces sp. NPDC007907 TaxID=3364789 RepID=UPI0036E768B1
MRTRAITAIAVLLLTLTACNDGDSTTQSNADKPSQAASYKAPAEASAPPKPLRFGSGWKWADTDEDGSPISGTTTVLSYTQPADDVGLPEDIADSKNPEWAVLEVKVCVDSKSSSVTVSQEPWALGFPDDTRLDAPIFSGSGVPKPEYATNGATVNPGDCLRGKITFDIERGSRPDSVVYGRADRDTVEWAIPKN